MDVSYGYASAEPQVRGRQVPQIINRTRKRHLIDLSYGIRLMAYSLNMSQMEHGCSAGGRAYTDLGGSNTDLPMAEKDDHRKNEGVGKTLPAKRQVKVIPPMADAVPSPMFSNSGLRSPAQLKALPRLPSPCDQEGIPWRTLPGARMSEGTYEPDFENY